MSCDIVRARTSGAASEALAACDEDRGEMKSLGGAPVSVFVEVDLAGLVVPGGVRGRGKGAG